MKEVKQIFKWLFVVLLFITLGIIIIISSIRQRQNRNELNQEDFNTLLDSTNYYFVGELLCYKYLYRGGGILKLKTIQSNPNHKVLHFNGNLVSTSNKDILHPATIFFSSKDTIRDQLEVGDIVKYNFNQSRKYQVYREGRLIFQSSPVINNPKLEKYLIELENIKCPIQ